MKDSNFLAFRGLAEVFLHFCNLFCFCFQGPAQKRKNDAVSAKPAKKSKNWKVGVEVKERRKNNLIAGEIWKKKMEIFILFWLWCDSTW